MKQANLTLKDNVFFVAGDIDFSNVMSLRQKSLAQFNHQSELAFDFSQVKSSDSSGLALVIEWIKLSKDSNKKIKLMHIPEDLMLIAKASDLDSLISNN